MNNGGTHGLTEVLYCFGEAANNNGSAFAGLNANTPFYNVGAGIVIWIGRFIPIISILAIVGRLASQKTVEASSGTLPTHGWTFGLTLTGVIIIVAALTFFPVLCLGSIVEHGLMLRGRTFYYVRMQMNEPLSPPLSPLHAGSAGLRPALGH